MTNPGALRSVTALSMAASMSKPEAKPWINAGLAFIYPEACQLCGKQRAKLEEGLVCSSCWQHVRFIKPPFCDRCGLPFDGAITALFFL